MEGTCECEYVGCITGKVMPRIHSASLWPRVVLAGNFIFRILSRIRAPDSKIVRCCAAVRVRKRKQRNAVRMKPNPICSVDGEAGGHWRVNIIF
jgi:hypothetical protein